MNAPAPFSQSAAESSDVLMLSCTAAYFGLPVSTVSANPYSTMHATSVTMHTISFVLIFQRSFRRHSSRSPTGQSTISRSIVAIL